MSKLTSIVNGFQIREDLETQSLEVKTQERKNSLAEILLLSVAGHN